jgi:hypothetical protein
MGSELDRLRKILARPMNGPLITELYVKDPVNGVITQMEDLTTLGQINVRMADTTNQNVMTCTLIPIVNLAVIVPAVKMVKMELATIVQNHT